MATAEELVCETTEVTQWTRAMASAATTVAGVLSAKQSVHSHASKTTFSRRTIYTAGAIRHDWFHGAIRMAHGLRSIGMCDELRRLGGTEDMFGLGSGSVARLGGLGRDLPLRNTSRKLNVVVFLTCAIPLRNPTRGQRRRSKRRAFGLGRGRARHSRSGCAVGVGNLYVAVEAGRSRERRGSQVSRREG